MNFLLLRNINRKHLNLSNHISTISVLILKTFSLCSKRKVVLAQGELDLYRHDELLSAGMRCEVRIASGFGIHAYGQERRTRSCIYQG